MTDISRRTLLKLAGVAPFVGTALGVSGCTRPVEAMSSLARKRIQEQHLPNVPLITHEGRRVSFYDDLVKDKIVMLNFFYATCSDICPTVSANLTKVQNDLGDLVGRKIFMYSFTLEPEADNVDVIRAYRKTFDARPGWTFLTGKSADIEELRKAIGFKYSDPKIDRDKTQHAGNVRYGNEPLMLWAACPGMADAQWIAESVQWMVHPETTRVQPSNGEHGHPVAMTHSQAAGTRLS